MFSKATACEHGFVVFLFWLNGGLKKHHAKEASDPNDTVSNVNINRTFGMFDEASLFSSFSLDISWEVTSNTGPVQWSLLSYRLFQLFGFLVVLVVLVAVGAQCGARSRTMRGIGGTLAYLDQSALCQRDFAVINWYSIIYSIDILYIPENPVIPVGQQAYLEFCCVEIQRQHDRWKISDFLRIQLTAATCGICRDKPPRIVDQGSRLLGKMQGYVQGHTPLETQRVCHKAALGTGTPSCRSILRLANVSGRCLPNESLLL